MKHGTTRDTRRIKYGEDDALPLGRVNGARFRAMIRKELEDSLEVDVTEGHLWVKIKNDKPNFNMPRAFSKFSKLTTAQLNLMTSVLRTSKEDKAREIYHPYQNIKKFYKGCRHLGNEYKRDEEVID
ncbi:hypothetical protein Tco_1401545 [Tanacetum coccineum]